MLKGFVLISLLLVVWGSTDSIDPVDQAEDLVNWFTTISKIVFIFHHSKKTRVVVAKKNRVTHVETCVNFS
jgi:hypothetical protein